MRCLVGACGIVAVLSGSAAAHIQIREPMQRSTGQKEGPCGTSGSSRGSNVCRYRPGATITIRFEETVEHPGHFRLSFDDDGQDFRNPTSPGDTSVGDGVVILDNAIPDRNVDGDGQPIYTYEVTLPDTTCTNCTLQLIQVMSTGSVYGEADLYYQCADIELADDAPETPSAACISGGGGDNPDGGDGGGGSSEGCSATGRAGTGPFAALSLALALLLIPRSGRGRRRRRDTRRAPRHPLRAGRRPFRCR